jgi:hypothetical protein
VVRNVSALAPDGRAGLRASLGLSADAPLVLHQGAPAPARGCEVLVQAIERVPGAHLAFLGDPEPGYAAQLEEFIAGRAGVRGRVWLLPSVPLEDLLAHTAEADVGVTLLQDTCLNHRLALPNKLFEYIAAGVPVVAAALPETQRLVESHGVGWCVAGEDPAAVAGALRVALHGPPDPGLRERLARAGEELSWEREQERLLGLYRRLSAIGPRRRASSGATGAGVRPAAAVDEGSGPRKHQSVTAQSGHSRERPIPAPGAPSQGRQQGDRAAYDIDGVPAQRRAQLADANHARVAVSAPHARLPHDHPTAGREHPAHLGKRPPDVLAPAHGG